jgi:hypothetical protein
MHTHLHQLASLPQLLGTAPAWWLRCLSACSPVCLSVHLSVYLSAGNPPPPRQHNSMQQITLSCSRSVLGRSRKPPPASVLNARQWGLSLGLSGRKLEAGRCSKGARRMRRSGFGASWNVVVLAAGRQSGARSQPRRGAAEGPLQVHAAHIRLQVRACVSGMIPQHVAHAHAVLFPRQVKRSSMSCPRCRSQRGAGVSDRGNVF